MSRSTARIHRQMINFIIAAPVAAVCFYLYVRNGPSTRGQTAWPAVLYLGTNPRQTPGNQAVYGIYVGEPDFAW